jgi:transposase
VAGRGARRPERCRTRAAADVIEERLFARRKSLFTDLSVVLFDTTSLYFSGAGGATLGRHGKSKDHRPDLRQVIVGVVLDEAGRPICSEIWPGNLPDVRALLPVVDRLRSRFGIARMWIVADRGMISAETALEACGIEYILGARAQTRRCARSGAPIRSR